MMKNLMIKRAICPVSRSFDGSGILGVTIPMDCYQRTVQQLICNVQKRRLKTIYVTFYSPAISVLGFVLKCKIQRESIQFIDTISDMLHVEEIPKNTSRLAAPNHLNKTLSLMDKMLTKDSVIIIDNLSTILTYNTDRETEQFLTKLVKRMEKTGCYIIILSFDEHTHESVILDRVCNKTLKI